MKFKALCCRQPTLFLGNGSFRISQGVEVGFYPSPYYFSSYGHIEARHHSATIEIGENTKINNNLTIIAEHNKIAIGKNCKIGWAVTIIDSNFHGLKPEHRNISRPEDTEPVSIGDNVFIGSNAMILKGSRIPNNTIVPANAIVTRKSYE